MEYTNGELEARLVVKDRPTVREQLRYRGEMGTAQANAAIYERLWNAAQFVIEAWECPYVGKDANLDELDSPKAAKAIEWAGLVVFGFMQALEEVPKNS